MSDNPFEPYKIPELGRRIARFYATLWTAVKMDAPRVKPPRITDKREQRYLNYVLWIFILLAPAWLTVGGVIIGTLIDLFQGHFDGDLTPEELRWRYVSITALLAALGALIAVPFTLIRMYVNERQATTAEQGLITDRITKAVEQLGAEKTVKKRDGWRVYEVTEPNLEVRLGAIYALERISRDSLRDHIPIMETLCAYVRNNAPADEAEDSPLPPFPDPAPKDADEEKLEERDAKIEARGQALHEWLEGLRPLSPPRLDIAAVLTVISRRGPRHREHEAKQDRPFKLDFTRVNLQRCDLSGLDFGGADMRYARLEGTNLMWAKMEGANLIGVRMEGANLSGADMEGADLSGAKMEGAYLSGAEMRSADLSSALFSASLQRSADCTAA